MLRLGAIAIALLPPLLGLLLHGVAWGAWIGPGLAIVGGVAFTLARPRVRALVLLGTMLAVLAGLAAPQLPVDPAAALEQPPGPESPGEPLRREDAVDEHPTPAWVHGVLVVLATLGSLACLWIAAQGREQPSVGDPRRRSRAKRGAASLLLLLCVLPLACGHRHPRGRLDYVELDSRLEKRRLGYGIYVPPASAWDGSTPLPLVVHLRRHGVPHQALVFPGGHGWQAWSKVFPFALCHHLRDECSMVAPRSWSVGSVP